jgi:predicted HAD superfamily phosphohydrolase YqeG
MIGDNPATDGIGAARLGIRFLQVEPGELPDPDCIAARAGR